MCRASPSARRLASSAGWCAWLTGLLRVAALDERLEVALQVRAREQDAALSSLGWGGRILLLPALPGDWSRGALRGVRVRNAARLDLAWRDGRLVEARLHSERGGDYRVEWRGRELGLSLAAGETARLRAGRDGLLRA